MSKLVFYRQLRMDGGIRTAVELDGETVFGLFEEGETDHNPRLRWFVDLRCEGPKLPVSARAARRWLLKHAPTIAAGFHHCAAEVRAGIDPEVYTMSWEGFPDAPSGVQMRIVFTAARRSDAIGMSEVLSEIGSNWDQYVRRLKPALTARS